MKYIKKYNESVDIDWEDIDEEEIFMDMVYSDEFTDFLIDNNAYDEYLHAMKRVKNCKTVDEINFRLRGVSKGSVIDKSFGWSGTPQGHGYWSRLHEKWNDLISIKRRRQDDENYEW